jgi:hypothetical protein
MCLAGQISVQKLISILMVFVAQIERKNWPQQLYNFTHFREQNTTTVHL